MPRKLFLRGHVVDLTVQFGPLGYDDWKKHWGGRYTDMGGWPKELTVNDDYSISRNTPGSGIYELRPHLPPDSTTEEIDAHVYTQIAFRGGGRDVSFDATGDTRLSGRYVLADNFCTYDAYVWDPQKPWNQVPCRSFLAVRFATIIDAMPNPKVEEMLQIADGSANTNPDW